MRERLWCDIHTQTRIEGWYFVGDDRIPKPLCSDCRRILEDLGYRLIGAAMSGEPAIRVKIRNPERADRLAAEWADW